MRSRLVSVLVLTILVAGCFGGFGGGGKGKSKADAYQGEFREFDLYLNYVRADGQLNGWKLYEGTLVDAWAFSDDGFSISKATIPGPTIRVREGDTVRINFYTSAPMAHTLHWHGLHVPWQQDGVPYVSQLPIGDSNLGGVGNVYTYDFQVNQSGTYWYHCHVDTAHHMDMGMYGAFIVDPKNPASDPPYDVESIIMLDEWDKSHAHSNAMAINNALSKSGDPRVTANDVYSFIRDYLLMSGVYDDTIAEKIAPNAPGVRENRSWYPITYAPYFAEYDTFLMNGHAFPDTEPILVKNGQILRMRIINAGEQMHMLHLHGHHMFVTHTDGYIVPLLYQLGDKAADIRSELDMHKYAEGHDTIALGPGQRVDVYVYLNNPGPWMLHDHIALNEQNDYISPGGMATMLCYEDGWEKAASCKDGHHAIEMGQEYTSGDVLRAAYNLLKQDLVVEQAKSGGASGAGAGGDVVSQLPNLVPHH